MDPQGPANFGSYPRCLNLALRSPTGTAWFLFSMSISLRSLFVGRTTRQLFRRPCRRYATEAAMADTSLKPSSYGQPVFQSHPHIRKLPVAFEVTIVLTPLTVVQTNELTPGIPTEEYERRRKALMDSLPDDSIVVSVAAPIKYMSNSEPCDIYISP